MTAPSDESVQPAVAGVRVDVGVATDRGRRDSNEDASLASGGVYVVTRSFTPSPSTWSSASADIFISSAAAWSM